MLTRFVPTHVDSLCSRKALPFRFRFQQNRSWGCPIPKIHLVGSLTAIRSCLLPTSKILGNESNIMEEKLAYIKLNSQTACPRRAAVPVNQGCRGRFIHSQHPDRLRSWLRPFQLCPADNNPSGSQRQVSVYDSWLKK